MSEEEMPGYDYPDKPEPPELIDLDQDNRPERKNVELVWIPDAKELADVNQISYEDLEDIWNLDRTTSFFRVKDSLCLAGGSRAETPYIDANAFSERYSDKVYAAGRKSNRDYLGPSDWLRPIDEYTKNYFLLNNKSATLIHIDDEYLLKNNISRSDSLTHLLAQFTKSDEAKMLYKSPLQNNNRDIDQINSFIEANSLSGKERRQDLLGVMEHATEFAGQQEGISIRKLDLSAPNSPGTKELLELLNTKPSDDVIPIQPNKSPIVQ
jgi:hypothetical protein